MKKILLLGIALLALTASAAFAAGLDITWDACNQGAGRTSAKTFDCAGGAPSKLYYCFQSPISSSTFFGMDFLTDVEINDAAILPQFWHWEAGGCNANALTISSDRPLAQCPRATHVNLWGTGGNPSGLITAYGAGIGGANRARISMTVTRAASDPIDITAGTNYFGCILTFNMDNASELGGTCAGCPSSATIVWVLATLFSTAASSIGPEVTSTPFSGPGLVSDCATVNGGFCCTIPGSGLPFRINCTPVLDRTWGALKTLYR